MPAHQPPILVIKLGSSVLSDVSRYRPVADRLAELAAAGRRVLVVVSAVGNTTDELLAEAHAIGGPDADPHGIARLLLTGEEASAARLGLALGAVGVHARIADVHQIDFQGTGDRLDALPTSVNADALHALFASATVVIVPGYIVIDEDGEPLLTGRGGSDLSALYLAYALGADAALIKDVDGVYEFDPNEPTDRADPPRRFATMPWSHAAQIGGAIVQAKAVRHAQRLELTFRVTTLDRISDLARGAEVGTLIGDVPAAFDTADHGSSHTPTPATVQAP